MCGIAGTVSRLEETPDPLEPILDRLRGRVATLLPGSDLEAHRAALSELEATSPRLRREGSSWQLARSPELARRLTEMASRLESVDAEGTQTSRRASSELEQWNAIGVRCRDLAWLYQQDILGTAGRAIEMMGPAALENRHLFHHGWKLGAILSSLGRLEVRGRDSLGLSCLLTFPVGEAFEAWSRLNADALLARRAARDFVHGAVVLAGEHALFTFKVAQEVGALGDNCQALQSAISRDRLFLSALSMPGVASNLFGHTRWASNGIINEPNCHPVTQETLGGSPQGYWISAALNGDIDNYQELRARFERETGRTISASITTDTKIIPVMVGYYYERTGNLDEAFRLAVREFEGSLAIVMHSTLQPDRVYLALAGSGQSLCVGVSEDGYVVASEVYGLVEQTDRFVRMDGMRERVPGDPQTRGQVFVLQAPGKGRNGLTGVSARSFDGAVLPLAEADVQEAEITTRDINRAGYSHYLLKEINEAPRSVRRTLHGKFHLTEDGSRLTWLLAESTLPPRVVESLKQGKLRDIVLIGQGTAAVAGDAVAAYMHSLLSRSGISVRSTQASELSGYDLEDDMSDTLVIAISQSGTTTDTNRTVDLVRGRGAPVIAIVNRRNSDLTYKADGVLYTSDGRDIEMSVASTKAFYSQVIAGYIMALYFADQLDARPRHAIVGALQELLTVPRLMESLLQRQGEVEALARAHAPKRRDWAVAGSGANRAAADEIRIKLSELCYKSIASDSIEDKKHIDLSSEPLVLVCAAGLPAVALKDAIKEVAIFKSHKSCPIVIASEGALGFEPYSAGLLRVPAASEAASVLLNTVVGHLWGYYSARAIDDGAAAMRRARALAVKHTSDGASDPGLLEKLHVACRQILDDLQAGRFNSSLSSDTAGRLTLLFQFVLGRLPLAFFAEDFGAVGNVAKLYQKFIEGLSQGIHELARPIDAIKHQAKTITVGISRLEEEMEGTLFDGLKASQVLLEAISYKDMMLLKMLSPAIASVTGSTRYRLSHLGELGEPIEDTRIDVEARTGVAATLQSRTARKPVLIGNKSWVVSQREAYVGVGRSDGRPIVILPLFSRGVCDGLLLLHVTYQSQMSLADKRSLMQQVHHRYDELRAQVTEADLPWTDDYLQDLTPQEIATEPLDNLVRSIVQRPPGVCSESAPIRSDPVR